MKDYSSMIEMSQFNQETSGEINSLIFAQKRLIDMYIMSGDNISSYDRVLLLEEIGDHNVAIQKRLAKMLARQNSMTRYFEERLKKEQENKEESE